MYYEGGNEEVNMEKISTQENAPITLRKAGIKDIPSLIELEKSVSGESTYFSGLEEGGWEKELQNNTVYLIEKGDVTIGNISYEIKSDDNAYLSDLVVDPRYQGHGIAREALVKVLGELEGFKRIDLMTHPDNKAAIGLYHSLGFVIESRKENHFGDGEPRLMLVLKRK